MEGFVTCRRVSNSGESPWDSRHYLDGSPCELREFTRNFVRSYVGSIRIGFYSMLPIDTVDVVEAEPRDYLEFYVTLIAGFDCMNVAVSHPTPPVGKDNHSDRNTQLSNLGEAVSLLEGPTVLIGDLNITMWSHAYDKLLEKTGLRDARKGFVIEPTWPLLLPIAMIPIDHAFVSKDVDVIHFRTKRGRDAPSTSSRASTSRSRSRRCDRAASLPVGGVRGCRGRHR